MGRTHIRDTRLEEPEGFMPSRPDPGLSLTALSEPETTNEVQHARDENYSGRVPSLRMAWNGARIGRPRAPKGRLRRHLQPRPWLTVGEHEARSIGTRLFATLDNAEKSAEELVQYDGEWCGSGGCETAAPKAYEVSVPDFPDGGDERSDGHGPKSVASGQQRRAGSRWSLKALTGVEIFDREANGLCC